MSYKTGPIQPRMTKKGPFTVEVAGIAAIPGETIPRRNARCPDKLLTTPEEGIKTMVDFVRTSAVKFGDAKALGSRKLIKKHHETKTIKKFVNGKEQEVEKKWTYFEMSAYEYISYKELEVLTHQLGAGLRKLGLEAPDRVHMFASTCAHWLALAHGAMCQSMSIVTAYDTLGEEGLRHSLIATKAEAIFLEPHLLALFIRTLADATSIKYIITNTDSEEDVKEEDLLELKSSHPHVQILSYEDLRTLGEQNPIALTLPSPDDVCCIMYTSGSGGVPKGVELKHRQVVAAVAGADSVVKDLVSQADSILAYLPLAHIFEFVFEHSALFWGFTMGYGSFRTLSQANCRNCKSDILEFKPTILVGVPAVWETIKKAVLANVEKASSPVQAMFWSALAMKKSLLRMNIPGSNVLDALVFQNVKDATGGRLRFGLSGAALIAQDTQELLSMAMCPIVNGYGGTETAAMGTICDPLSWTTSAHGIIPGSIETKLVDFPEANYLTSNTPLPQGEVWVRGPPVMERYFNIDELTAEVMTPDGWYKTGDIGQWEKNGMLTLIDRKKNLVKTLNGEYIALEKLESIYRSATIVANICIYASITETKPIAIIVPVEVALKQLATSLGVEGHGIEDLTHDPRIVGEICKLLLAVGRKAGLANIELIQAVILSDEEWTPQNNLVTATNTLNRRAILDKFQKQIDGAYGKL